MITCRLPSVPNLAIVARKIVPGGRMGALEVFVRKGACRVGADLNRKERTRMASKTVTVGSSVGLHARPAALIAEAAGAYDDEILLTLGGSDEEGVDAASSLMIMTLGAEQGAEVTVESDNADAVEAIAALIARDLDNE